MDISFKQIFFTHNIANIMANPCRLLQLGGTGTGNKGANAGLDLWKNSVKIYNRPLLRMFIITIKPKEDENFTDDSTKRLWEQTNFMDVDSSLLTWELNCFFVCFSLSQQHIHIIHAKPGQDRPSNPSFPQSSDMKWSECWKSTHGWPFLMVFPGSYSKDALTSPPKTLTQASIPSCLKVPLSFPTPTHIA